MGAKRKQRFHYIPEWAERLDKKQADIEKALDINKGTASRWFSGTIPRSKELIRLARFLNLQEPVSLFRHPDDDWVIRRLSEVPEREREYIKTILKSAPSE